MKEEVLAEAKSDLIDLIKKQGEISVEEGSEALGLAKTTVRQHLTTLETMGFIKSRSHRHGRGRPRKMYSLTQKSEAFFEKREREFLIDFLEHLIEQGEEDLIRDFIRKLAGDLRDGLDVSHLDFDRRVHALEALADRQGFMAQTAEKDDRVVLEFCNCPFRRVAEVTDYICELELAHIEDVLGTGVDRIRHRLKSDQTCAYRIKTPDA